MLILHAGSSKQTQIEMRFDAGFLYKCANSLNAKLTHIWGHFLSSPPPTSGHVPTLLWLILLGLNDGQERRLWCKPLSHVAAPGLGCFLETVGFISGCTVRLWNKRLIVFFISVSTSKQILLKSWSFWRFLCYVSCFGERFLSLSFSCLLFVSYLLLLHLCHPGMFFALGFLLLEYLGSIMFVSQNRSFLTAPIIAGECLKFVAELFHWAPLLFPGDGSNWWWSYRCLTWLVAFPVFVGTDCWLHYQADISHLLCVRALSKVILPPCLPHPI